MAGGFEAALAFVLRWEGGYVDDPRDPGGATNMGITERTLSTWRDAFATKDDVCNLTREEAAAIYQYDYWNACRCDELPDAIALVVFDTAVNCGPRRSVTFVQSVLGVLVDGIAGDETIAAAAKCDVAVTVRQLVAARRAFLESLAGWNIFGDGWSARCAALEQQALAIANGGGE